LRTGKSKYYVGVVKDVKLLGRTALLLFHFPKTSAKFDEWVEFGTSRICPVNTKSIPTQVKKKLDKHQSSSPRVEVSNEKSPKALSVANGNSHLDS
jgi:hypothetical protein